MNKNRLILLIVIYGVAIGFFTKATLASYSISKDIWSEVIFLEKMTYFSTFALFIFFRFTGLLSYIMLFTIPLLICLLSLLIYIILSFSIGFSSSGLLPIISISLINFTGTLRSIAVYWNSSKSVS
jgi:hypothetical protein